MLGLLLTLTCLLTLLCLLPVENIESLVLVNLLLLVLVLLGNLLRSLELVDSVRGFVRVLRRVGLLVVVFSVVVGCCLLKLRVFNVRVRVRGLNIVFEVVD